MGSLDFPLVPWDPMVPWCLGKEPNLCSLCSLSLSLFLSLPFDPTLS